MLMQQLRHVLLGPIGKTMGIGLGVWLLATPPVAAVENTAQLLSGGIGAVEGQTRYTAPGSVHNLTPDSPGPGLGEQAVQIRIPKGQLRDLRVSVTTESVPSSGSLTVMVRLNGANTLLTCSVTQTADCNSIKAVNVPGGGSRLAIRHSNNFVDAGSILLSYTLIFD